jgi:hypothetical protein
VQTGHRHRPVRAGVGAGEGALRRLCDVPVTTSRRMERSPRRATLSVSVPETPLDPVSGMPSVTRHVGG